MRHRHGSPEGRSRHDAGEHRGHHHRGRTSHRVFDYGELRLLCLALIAESPRHGYELMKEIEERMGGSYTPSPGVIYPTLAWLEDMGYVAAEAAEAGRKRFGLTDEGAAFLTANKSAIDGLTGRVSAAGANPAPSEPAPVMRAVENLKTALRLRFKRSPLDAAAAETIAAAIDQAAQTVERS